jgi:pimeloyl-ACP methyl ester carboxylesterase
LKTHSALKISVGNDIFNCRISGNGEKAMICFHGFGQDGRAFRPIEERLPDHTFYCFDLPFHGETRIENPQSYLTSDRVQLLIQQLLDSRGIKRFSILAFSIGARLAFPIIESFAANIENIWLLAPDGTKNSFWYALATGNKINRKIFRYFMQNPEAIFMAINLLKSMHFIDSSTHSLIEKSMANADKRILIYHTWTYLSVLKNRLEELSKTGSEYEWQIQIFAGIRDQIIKGLRLAKAANGMKNVTVVFVEAGHHDLIKSFAEKALNGL